MNITFTVSVRPKWWKDCRRIGLIKDINHRFTQKEYTEIFVDGLMLEVWKMAQNYWIKGKLIPFNKWESVLCNQYIIDNDLAFKLDNGIYVNGSSEHFAWIKKYLSQT